MNSKLYKLALWYIKKCNAKCANKYKEKVKSLTRLTYPAFDKYLRAIECQYSYIDEEVSDNMCECRKLKDYRSLFKTSCGYIFGLGKEFKYCPYCGRKIKVGGVDG